MECLRCGKENKYEFCRECKEIKHRAWAIISQNKKKLKHLIESNILEPELFHKFMLYTNNIITEWKIYMEFVEKKSSVLFKFLNFAILLCSLLLLL